MTSGVGKVRPATPPGGGLDEAAVQALIDASIPAPANITAQQAGEL
jgi:hypothetical protein